MPAIQNVERRGAVYYWRRTVRFLDGKPFTLRLSLRTTNQAVARRRGCALTVKSETLKMTLRHADSTATLTAEQKASIFRIALENMRDELDRNHVQFQSDEPEDATYLVEGYIGICEAMMKEFIVHGIPANAGSREHVDERLSDLSDDQRQAVVDLFEMKPDWGAEVLEAAGRALDRFNVERTDASLAIARKVMLEGRLAGAMEFRRRLADPMTMWSQFAASPVVPPAQAPAVAVPLAVEVSVDEPWASMTPTQAAARFVAENPKILGDAKRKARWTEKTRSQFEAAARLLEKSYGAKPFRLLNRQSIVELNDHFSRLPTSHHKSSRHQNMTLEEICAEAAAEIASKKRSPDTIGLGATTTNRHFLFLKELTTWFAKQVPTMAVIEWADFLYEDERAAREQREAYTEEEGRALFRLSIWIGCKSVARRLEIGSEIHHDAGYWVPLIAWYTGCRREEICQLTLDDVGESGDIWYFTVTDENGGRIKNLASKRDVPFAEELMRLGLLAYVEALRAAGETMLFPELRTEANNRNYGDVYYKIWWTKLAKRLSFIEPGQALHSFRHTVTTELKHQEVFLETRADLIGHAMPGETAGRYSKAARLARLKEAVDQIPKVTDRIQPAAISLLSQQSRSPRPARRRGRSTCDE